MEGKCNHCYNTHRQLNLIRSRLKPQQTQIIKLHNTTIIVLSIIVTVHLLTVITTIKNLLKLSKTPFRGSGFQ